MKPLSEIDILNPEEVIAELNERRNSPDRERYSDEIRALKRVAFVHIYGGTAKTIGDAIIPAKFTI